MSDSRLVSGSKFGLRLRMRARSIKWLRVKESVDSSLSGLSFFRLRDLALGVRLSFRFVLGLRRNA